ncbi:MAG TPA: AraC family transcriptional regulator ligand-binding domain-containing protein [Rhizomicrobium sp.]|nr:AraC family transcriptional regulator ligand-binding domain-containing protein [Rhizomicrobium sp.]
MRIATELERLPMTMGYFRLILRGFGDSDAERAALLDGTGVGDEDLRNPAADISVFQQVRQIENASALCGPGWAISRPKLWDVPAHGALGVAVVSAPTLADSMSVLERYGHVRSPWFKISVRPRAQETLLELKITAPIETEQWRPMMEIAFLAIKAMLDTALGRISVEMIFHFACAKPDYADRLTAALGGAVKFQARTNHIALPSIWRSVVPTHVDPPLYAHAVAELEDVRARLEAPTNLRAQVERLLRTMPVGRLDSPSVARTLGVSRRTLARRLAETHTSFRMLLDAEIKTRARRLLSSQKLSRPEMAEQLGYRDPTSFSRACRRWFADER